MRSGVSGFPRTVLSALISQVVAKLNAGIGLLNGGSAVSASNPLPVLSAIDYRTSQAAATLAGKNYKVWVACAATPSKNSAVQIENPADSGYTLFVIAASGYNSTGTMKWYPLVNSIPLASNNGFTSILKVGVAASIIKMNSEALLARSTNDSIGVNIAATTPNGTALFLVGEFYVIPAGSCLRFEGETQGVGMTLSATVIQIPNSEM